ncbi:hypothetical protein CAPTEDRAFT_220947, partial [Capitella teleta]
MGKRGKRKAAGDVSDSEKLADSSEIKPPVDNETPPKKAKKSSAGFSLIVEHCSPRVVYTLRLGWGARFICGSKSLAQILWR